MIGIYKIENIINHKVYIGQSNNIEVRWKAHKYRLQKNTHDNQHLQKSYNKYGENNFNFEIVELCCPLLLNKYETKWFNIYCGKIGKSNIYNLAHTGNAHNTSDETRLKISNSNKNKKHFFSYNYLKKKKELCAKKVYQYSLCGNFIKSYKSIKDALDSI